MQNTSPISALSDALLDPKPLPAVLLYQFSDLSNADLKELAKLWPLVSLDRRRNLLKDLTELAESDNLLDFEGLGKLALQDEDTDVLCGAVDLLFACEDKHLIPEFLRLLIDLERSELVRAAAANALGPYVYLGEMEGLKPEVLKSIEETLLASYSKDPSDLVRRRALESLGYSSREEIPAFLQKAINHPDPQWVEAALFAMGRSADEQWAEDIMEYLDDPNREIRLQAIHAAGGVGLSEARPKLLKMLSVKEDEEFRKEAVWALSQIGGEGVLEAFMRLQAHVDDDEELNLLEEAIDTLQFTEDSTLYDLMDFKSDPEALLRHLHGVDDEDEDEEDLDKPDYDEWDAYLNEDGDDDDDDEDDDALFVDEEDFGEDDDDLAYLSGANL